MMDLLFYLKAILKEIMFGKSKESIDKQVLEFKNSLKTIEWQGDQDMIFLVTEYNDPNVLQEMISFDVNELVKYPQQFTLALPEKFSIYTRRIFDKYTYEDIRA